MAKRRTKRKELVKGPDEFITLTGKTIQWARENAKTLIYGACLFFAVVILISGFRMYKNAQMASASTQLSHTITIYKEAVEKKDSAVETLEVVRPEFERLVDTYGSQAEGRVGRILFGHIALAGQDTDEALGMYAKAYKTFDKDPSLKNVVLNGLAKVHLEKGETKAAIENYEKIVQGGSSLFKDNALFHLGCLYKETGDIQKSSQYFEQLDKNFPTSIFAEIAKEKKAT